MRKKFGYVQSLPSSPIPTYYYYPIAMYFTIIFSEYKDGEGESFSNDIRIDNSNAEIWQHFHSKHIDNIDLKRAFSVSSDRRVIRNR